jgi:RimJ/RimL family protein N-acetyltransferase
MELRDGSLLLRPWREEDAQAVFEACQDPEIPHWMPMIPRPYAFEDARAFVSGELALGGHQFAIVDDGRVVGSVGMQVDRRENGEVGYWCAADARRRGLVTRALRLLCRYAFDELEMRRLEAVVDPENIASQRVAEKVGFRREGVMRSHMQHPDGRRRDSVLYSLLPGELDA